MPNVNKWSKTAGTNATIDPDINFQEGQSPSSLNNSQRSVMSGHANDRDDTRGQLNTSGSTTAYTLTTNSINLSYQNGLEVWGKVNATSTGSVTLNVDGLGARKVYDNGSTVTTQLGAGGLTIGEHAGFQYDSAADGAVGGWIKISNPGIASTAIAANSITNAQLVNVATSTIKGRVTAATGSPEDLTMAQVVGLTAGMTALASNGVSLTDQLPIYDISATTGKSATPDKILEVLNLLTEDTSPSLTTDFLLSYDTSATTVKKIKPSTVTGKIAQVVSTEVTAVATGTTLVPYDDTIPQNTEGDQYMSLAITPQSATSTLIICVNAYMTISTAGGVITMALFQDSTASAIAATASIPAGTNQGGPVCLTHIMTSGTTSATTFKVRAGLLTAGTITLNGVGAARRFGGVAASTVTITEILP